MVRYGDTNRYCIRLIEYMKIIGSFILLTGYSIYLYLRIVKNMSGRQLAFWNVGSFLIVLINFFLFGQLSSFHFWYS